MRCNKCNSENVENAKFCQVCGNSITKIENPVLNSVSDTYNESMYNTINDQNTNENHENFSNQQSNIQNNINQSNQKETNDKVNSNQNNDNKQENNGLKTTSTLLGVVGIVVMFFNSTIAFILFIIGIILGAIYKSITKKKCFGLTLNIICLILNIIFFFSTVFIVNNIINDTKKSSECAEKGGYLQNGKCVGTVVDEEEKNNDNNTNINDNSFNSDDNENNTYIGLWSCKDNGTDTNLSINSLDQIDKSEYKISFSFIKNQTYMITYSSSVWEKGTYTINLNKKDAVGFAYYDLYLTTGELYESGNYQKMNSTPKKHQFITDETFSRAFLIASDGSSTYSCYKN